MSEVLPQKSAAAISHSRLFGLDLVRVAAVTLVVIGHFLQHSLLPKWLLNFGRLGIFGVEIFFVLSGYLIGGIILNSISQDRFRTFADLRTFWTRRWLRTLPLYYLFFAIYLRYDWTGAQNFFEHLNFLVFMQNFAWRAPDFFLLAWSLAIEEYFYLLFPLFLWMALRFARSAKAIVVSVGFFLIVPLLLRAFSAPYPEWDGFNFEIRMLVVKRLDALMYGVAAAFIRDFYPAIWSKLRSHTKFSAFFFAALCVYMYLDNYGLWASPASWFLQVFYFPFLSLSIALLLPYFSQLPSRATLLARSITYVSTISYSIYLGHILVITWVQRWLDLQPGLLLRLRTQVWSLYLLYGLGTLVLASITYYFWEKPFIAFRDRQRTRERTAQPIVFAESVEA